MKKSLLKITAAIATTAMLAGVGFVSVKAASNVSELKAAAGDAYRTALFGRDYNSKAVSSYTASWTSTNNGFTVNIENFNNNNNGWSYIKTGNKANASVGYITTAAAIDKAIDKVTVTIDAVTVSNVNSIKLYTGTSASDITTEVGSYSIATGDQTVSIASPKANLFYKLAFDCKKGGSNGIVTVSKVAYIEASSTTPTKSLSSISVSGQQTEYYLGETVAFTGTCTATYDDNSTEIVTPEISAVDTSTTGSKTVTVTYGGKTTSYTINVISNELTVVQALAVDTDIHATANFKVTGYITNVDTAFSSQYNNITFSIADEENGSPSLKCYRVTTDASTAEVLTNGAQVRVTGKLTVYSGAVQVSSGATVEILKAGQTVDLSDVEATVAEALDAANNLNDNGTTLNKYIVTGYITEIVEAYSSEFKNMTFKIADTADGANTLLCFRAKTTEEASVDYVVGAKVAVTGSLKKFVKNGETTLEIDSGCTVELLESAPSDPVDPVDPTEPGEEVTVTKTIQQVATENSWVSSVTGSSTNADIHRYGTFALDDVITISSVPGSGNGKFNCSYYYSDKGGHDWRIFHSESGVVTVSAKDGYNLCSVQFDYNQNNGGYLINAVSGETATVSGVSADFAAATSVPEKTNGSVRITSISVTYKSTAVAPTYGATEFAQEFNTSVVCDNGVTAPSKTVWAEMASKYDTLSTADKATLSSTEANQSGSDVEKCVAKYDYILTKYGVAEYTNFIGRTVKSSSPTVKSIVSDQSGVTTIVTVTAIASISLVGAFTIARKRKEF